MTSAVRELKTKAKRRKTYNHIFYRTQMEGGWRLLFQPPVVTGAKMERSASGSHAAFHLHVDIEKYNPWSQINLYSNFSSITFQLSDRGPGYPTSLSLHFFLYKTGVMVRHKWEDFYKRKPRGPHGNNGHREGGNAGWADPGEWVLPGVQGHRDDILYLLRDS